MSAVDAAGHRERPRRPPWPSPRSEEHTSELQSRQYLVCRLLLEKHNPHNAPSFATSTTSSLDTLTIISIGLYTPRPPHTYRRCSISMPVPMQFQGSPAILQHALR